MTILEIKTYPDPILTTPTMELTLQDIRGGKIQTLIEDMIDTCIDSGGVGLAANQVGEGVSLFIIRYKGNTFEVFINPRITWAKDKQHCKDEGCLSVPGRRFNVKRFKKVKLVYLDRNGEENILIEKRKKVAQVLQHEMDHLAGLCLPDKGKDI